MERGWSEFISLYGNVEGARAGFEIACETMLREHHSGKNVQQFAVSRGDGGIDIGVGLIGQEPIEIYQCKFFPDKIGPSQRSQITESFRRALNSSEYIVKHWTLCVPCVFTRNEHFWWGDFVKKMSEEFKIDESSIKIINGNELIDKMKKYGVYNRIFRIDGLLKLDEIYRIVKATAESKNDTLKVSSSFSKTVSNTISNYLNNKPNQNEIKDDKTIDVKFYRDVEIDYVAIKEFLYNAYSRGVELSDINFILHEDDLYRGLKDILRKNLELVKSDKSIDIELMYNLIEISYQVENSEIGLLRGIKELVKNLYKHGNLDNTYFTDSLYWFAKIMRYGSLSKLYNYQLRSGFKSAFGSEYSWFYGRFINHDHFKKFYGEKEAEHFRACFNHDLYDYLKFYGTIDYFAPITPGFYYKYGLPQIMELLVAQRKERLFWAYEDVTIYNE
jgi:hypothetical protein